MDRKYKEILIPGRIAEKLDNCDYFNVIKVKDNKSTLWCVLNEQKENNIFQVVGSGLKSFYTDDKSNAEKFLGLIHRRYELGVLMNYYKEVRESARIMHEYEKTVRESKNHKHTEIDINIFKIEETIEFLEKENKNIEQEWNNFINNNGVINRKRIIERKSENGNCEYLIENN